jgi:hypothetical protein
MSRQSVDVRDRQPSPPRRIERRAAIRYQTDQEASCAIGFQHQSIWGRVNDISVRGVALLLDRAVQPGTPLAVDILSKIHPLPLRVRAHVIHCQKHSSTTWIIGCAFDRPLFEDDLLARL